MQSIDETLHTPAMKQYLEIKKKYPEGILFFRMGDFYEMFLEDAEQASQILDIALTKRQNKIPMCGIPYHAADSYIAKLIQAGKSVVVCEQVKVDGAKVLPREVVRIITPGTVVEENLIRGFENNFLCFIFFGNQTLNLIFADISTSEIYHTETNKRDSIFVRTNFEKFSPSEILVFKEQAILWDNLEVRSKAKLSLLNSEQIQLPKTEQFLEMKRVIDEFLSRNFKENSFYFPNPVFLQENKFMSLDSNTIKSLNLLENENPREKEHTLFQVLNKLKTSSGKRLLRKKILFPLLEESKIREVWKKIELLSKDLRKLQKISELLSESSDLERLMGRFKAKKVFPRDFKTIVTNIEIGNQISEILQTLNFHFPKPVPKLQELHEFISQRIYERELPALLGSGKFLKDGFSEELDKARKAQTEGQDWILNLEEKEKKRTGLNTLKIRYNKVVGYYIELSRKDASLVPKDYLKKQTLVTSERFTLPELEEIERTILHADEIISEIEQREFNLLIQKVISCFQEIIDLANEFSELDYIQSLTVCKEEYNWIQPEINHIGEIFLENARHPVVEKYLPKGEIFTKNNTYLNTSSEAIAILTGPNMAGKSTYMRQVALIQILFQMGSYVPASKANLSIVDKIFTRIGSADNLTAGESTFFIEMKESAYILKNRTERSLILFDEIGRGTSTYDGLSLAWAIVEHLSRVDFEGKKTKTIFATHYHELTELEKESGVFNIFMDTMEKEGEIIFLRKVKKGKAKKSFGIYVAKLAGIPDSVVQRASEILASLESKKREIKYKLEEDRFLFPTYPLENSNKLQEIHSTLRNLDIDKLTPREALNFLYEWKAKLN
jgi:DNA mismatch repair protein MutS